jgi:hypothetical protein
MDPVSLVACSSIDAWLKRTASMVVRGEKLGGDLLIGQLACCGLGRRPFFLGARDPSKSVWST